MEGRLPPFGGWGKAAILTVLRKDFSGLLGVRPPDIDLGEPRLDAELDSGDLLSEGLGLDGVLIFEGRLDSDVDLDTSAGTSKLFLVFGAGSGGIAPAGGSPTGRARWDNDIIWFFCAMLLDTRTARWYALCERKSQYVEPSQRAYVITTQKRTGLTTGVSYMLGGDLLDTKLTR